MHSQRIYSPPPLPLGTLPPTCRKTTRKPGWAEISAGCLMGRGRAGVNRKADHEPTPLGNRRKLPSGPRRDTSLACATVTTTPASPDPRAALPAPTRGGATIDPSMATPRPPHPAPHPRTPRPRGGLPRPDARRGDDRPKHGRPGADNRPPRRDATLKQERPFRQERSDQDRPRQGYTPHI